MFKQNKWFAVLLLIISFLSSSSLYAATTINIPILVYHNLNPVKPGSMNLTPAKVESQISWLKANGFNMIPLQDVVDYLLGSKQSLPAKAIVITADDGWQSDYTYLYPIIKKYNVPVTLFIYPETISEGKHALTWEELKEMQANRLVTIQSHTYSHPNFKQEKRHLSPQAYEKFVQFELGKSKQLLEDKLGVKITTLAWPFGIYDSYLEQAAAQAGYKMAFSIDARPANKNQKPMAQPRFMIVDMQSAKTFTTIANETSH